MQHQENLWMPDSMTNSRVSKIFLILHFFNPPIGSLNILLCLILLHAEPPTLLCDSARYF